MVWALLCSDFTVLCSSHSGHLSSDSCPTFSLADFAVEKPNPAVFSIPMPLLPAAQAAGVYSVQMSCLPKFVSQKQFAKAQANPEELVVIKELRDQGKTWLEISKNYFPNSTQLQVRKRYINILPTLGGGQSGKSSANGVPGVSIGHSSYSSS
jgi:hypothetical protein